MRGASWPTGRAGEGNAGWVGAEIRADGSARITEVIDYDLGQSGDSHGIYRLKIGDPGRLVGGVHRHRIQYVLPEAVRGHRFAWDAVGAGWQVDRANAEVHVAGPVTSPDSAANAAPGTTANPARPCAADRGTSSSGPAS
ncbi:DUF2207 domain-containing protein [Streptomyces sp. NPDC056580]|uniref:DUF2207 domain-containing protein n=1 Tax=Streptomyces sp. NPDC056580 TaxID=3345872 RepID=UPI0036C61A67